MMNGKICMITGANRGIGWATARELAARGATVVMVCRDRERGDAARREIQQHTGNDEIIVLLADLSSQASIRALVAEFRERFPALHVLVNSAAILPGERRLTEDGIESQLAVNHLSYFYLTNLLLDVLQASVPARIVNIAAAVHDKATFDFNDLQSEKSYDFREVYKKTKLYNILFTYELARRLDGTGVTVNCLDPGVIATRLLGEYRGIPVEEYFTEAMGGAPLEEGAVMPVRLATEPEFEHVTGQYFEDGVVARSSDISRDRDVALRLWQASARLTGLA